MVGAWLSVKVELRLTCSALRDIFAGHCTACHMIWPAVMSPKQHLPDLLTGIFRATGLLPFRVLGDVGTVVRLGGRPVVDVRTHALSGVTWRWSWRVWVCMPGGVG